jgi:hypothetical protein
LDRAFFSRVGTQGSQVYNLQEPLPILEEDSEGTSNEGEGDGKRKTRGFKAKRYQLGKWLGLERGPIRIAWMQSLAVRLHGETLNNFQAEEFGQFIAEMLELHRSQPFDPLILAFVVRKLELVHVQLEGEGLKRKGARRQVRKLIKAVKQAESEGQEKVSIALLDGAIDKLEKQLSGEVDMVLYGQVEKQLETLVGTLDGPLSQHFQAYSELHQHVPDVESIDRHAHVLYLAIRFLLFRIRHSIVSSRTSSSFNRTNTLYSVSQLYTLLLDLSTAVVSSTLELSRLRQRQSSALYRILWAHLGVYDTRNTALQTLETLSSSEDTKAALPRHDPSLVAAAYDLIDLTLESTANLPPPVDGSVLPSHLPHDTRLIGVSTRFHRHALYLLSLPFAPSRRDLGSVSPSWCTFQRVLNSIERQRLHDSQCLRHKTFRYSRQEWEQDLVVQPAFAIHLLRATLLGCDSSPSTLPSRPSTEEGTPMSRLRELFDLMTKLEECCDMAGRDREVERKARKYFRKAVKVVVEEEWKGEGTRVWKDLIKKKVKDWATEKYRKPLGKLALHSW